MAAAPRRVVYIHSAALVEAADALPSNLGRASLTNALIDAFELLDTSGDGAASPGQVDLTKARVVQSQPATREELLRFHDRGYLNAVLGHDPEGSSSDSDASDASSSPSISNFRLRPVDGPSPSKKRKTESFGLEDDCPMFKSLSQYVLEVGGASIQAARELRDGRADVAIAWTGGRHHGKRGEAAGFCYVQDAALAILELRLPPTRPSPPASPSSDDVQLPIPLHLPSTIRPNTRIGRVMYVDIDLHHGDGVQDAFHATPHVLTLCAHLHGPGFYPSTGSLESTGPKATSSSFHALNLALEPGLASSSLLRLYDSCIEPTLDAFKPDAIVIQCGCDGLAGDPCKEWNLDLKGMGEVVDRIIRRGKRTLLLGGGGYDNANVARCWAYLTSVALGRPLDLDSPIPASMDDFAAFGPSFSLDVPAGEMRERNTEESLAKVEQAFRLAVEALKVRYRDK